MTNREREKTRHQDAIRALVNLFRARPDHEFKLEELYIGLNKPDGDPDTRRALWVLLATYQVEMTLYHTYKLITTNAP